MTKSIFMDRKNAIFSKEQLKTAATWWTQYLPGISPINYNSNNLDKERKESHAAIQHMTNYGKTITLPQYEKFVGSLIKEFYKLPIKTFLNDLKYISIGGNDRNHSGEILGMAAQKAGIMSDISKASLFFPTNVKMNIYENGIILLPDDIINTSQELHLYTIEDIKDPVACVFKGEVCRIVKIVPTELKKGKLLKYNSASEDNEDSDSHSYTLDVNSELNNTQDKIPPFNLYAQIFLNDFHPHQREAFYTIPDETVINILQKATKMKLFLKDDTYIQYVSDPDVYKYRADFQIGTVSLQKMATKENTDQQLYQYLSSVRKVMLAPQKGSIRVLDNYIWPVEEDDLLILDPQKGLRCYSPKSRNKTFKPYLCNDNGELISDVEYPSEDNLSFSIEELTSLTPPVTDMQDLSTSYDYFYY